MSYITDGHDRSLPPGQAVINGAILLDGEELKGGIRCDYVPIEDLHAGNEADRRRREQRAIKVLGRLPKKSPDRRSKKLSKPKGISDRELMSLLDRLLQEDNEAEEGKDREGS